MKKFLSNGLLFIILLAFPFLVLGSLYLFFDPFKVVKSYATYLDDNYIDLNRDYISTENFLANSQKYNYNSFIFGSSRAIAFSPVSWSKYLDEQAVPFVFDASGESVFGIYSKLRFLEKENVEIKNVLILFCRDGFFNDRDFIFYKGHLGIKHPKVTGESWIKFHFVFFKAYFNMKFLLGYYSFLITGRHNPFTAGIIIDKGDITIDDKTNQLKLVSWDNQIINNPKEYYESHRDIFYKREGEQFESEQKMDENHMQMLIEINEILERNHSKYKVVLGPIYDQVRFSLKDKELLVSIFQNHLYDFTGKNFITDNDTLWYEKNHFRPCAADSIMNIIYSESNYDYK